MHILFRFCSSPKHQIWYRASPRGTLKSAYRDFAYFNFAAHYCTIKTALMSNLVKFDVRAAFIAQQVNIDWSPGAQKARKKNRKKYIYVN